MKKTWMIFTGVMFCFLLAGCTCSLEKEVAEQLELGNTYLNEMNYDQAIVAYEEALELFNDYLYKGDSFDSFITRCEQHLKQLLKPYVLL